MKFLKTLELLEKEIFKAASFEDTIKRKQEYALIEINKMLKEHGHQNPDGSWDIKRYVYVDLSNLGLNEIPIKFNIVYGSFSCSYNDLTSLNGCPKVVNGSFYCYNNKLTSLEGCPKIVNGHFDCSFNEIKFTKEDVRKHCKVGGLIFT